MKPRVAIIGTGIAGMGAAHLLKDRAHLTLFERNDYVGGHTNTVTVDEHGMEIPIDTGFMVYNEVTYPNLVRLFRELQVPVKKTSMSFSVQHRPSGLEWNGSDLNRLFVQRRNLLRPRFYGFLLQIDRFNAQAPRVLEDPAAAAMSVKEYVQHAGFGPDFVDHYLIPMSSAVWSTPPDRMLEFPAVTLIRFFKNHGFLGLKSQFQWWTVDGGSRMYRDRLIAPLRDRIHTGHPVVRVERNPKGVDLRVADGSVHHFDRVIVACHADEALRLLADPSSAEQRLLAPFRYQANTATLHTDERIMPRRRKAWASWNYLVPHGPRGQGSPSVIYWMNSLQGVSQRRNYFVSINDRGLVDPEKTLRTIHYTHPLFSVEALKAQQDLQQLNDNGTTYFCGSYFRYGFHEDALWSAVLMARKFSGVTLWP